MNPIDYRIIPSYKQEPEISSEERKPYLFFHIPKTAGLSFSTGMGHIYQHLEKKLGYACCYARLDIFEKEGENLIKSASDFFEHYNQSEIGGFIVSHSPNKVLKIVNYPFKFITVFRDTVERVVSSYGYYCMRNKINPSNAHFESFIREEKNINVSTKTLLGIETTLGNEGLIAANMVIENFYAYCFIKDLDLMISHIISTEGLPNIKMGKENNTLSKYKFNGNKEQIELIKNLNSEDINLINKIGYNSKRIPDFQQNNNLHHMTVDIAGQQNETGYHAKSTIKESSQVLPVS